MTRLFSDASLSEYLQLENHRLYETIQKTDDQYFLDGNADDLTRYFEQEFLVDPVSLDVARITCTESETKIDVSSDPRRFFRNAGPHYETVPVLLYRIPFSGDSNLLKLNPSQSSWPSPVVHLEARRIRIDETVFDNNFKAAEDKFESTKGKIEYTLQFSRKDIESHNASLRNTALRFIQDRKQLMTKRNQARNELKYQPAKPGGESIKEVLRVKPKFARLPNLTRSGKENITFTLETYDHVISIIDQFFRTSEKAPQSFSALGEEDFRWHILQHLNTFYAGYTTAEAFNAVGKTDIMIQHEGEIHFIGECKIWSGQADYFAAIDQLLSYLTWRDTKAALIIFNRNKNFSSILSTIKEVTPQHPSFVCFVKETHVSLFQYEIASVSDRQKHVLLTVMAFDVPS